MELTQPESPATNDQLHNNYCTCIRNNFSLNTAKSGPEVLNFSSGPDLEVFKLFGRIWPI